MNAQDIVVGLARVGDDGVLLHRVFDGYTPNRATPLPDTAFGGVDDLTDAGAVEDTVSGLTHVRFRRPAVTADCFDHQAVPGLLHDLIFAFGSEMPRHSPDIPVPSDTAFYAPDLIKYHGADHRHWTTVALGATPPPAVDGEGEGEGEGEGASGCVPSPLAGYACQHVVDDTFVLHSNVTDDLVLRAGTVTDDGGYLGFGPSPTGGMVDSHVVLADRRQGTTRVLNLVDKVSTNPEASIEDDEGGERVISSSYSVEGGQLIVEQVRKRTTALLSPEGQTFVYARGPSSGDTGYHGTRKAAFRVVLGGSGGDGGGGVAVIDDGGVDGTSQHQARVAHGILMALGWGLFLPLGILASAHGRSAFARRFGSDGAWFTWGHRPLQILGLALTLSAFIVALVLLSPASIEAWPGHGIAGLIIMIGALSQPLNALLRPAPPVDPAHRPRSRTWWELLHRSVGYLTTIAALTNMSLGVNLYQTLEGGRSEWDALSVIVVLLQVVGAILVGRSLLHCDYTTDSDGTPLRASPPVKVPPREARPDLGPRVLSAPTSTSRTSRSGGGGGRRSRSRHRAHVV
jgi:hypothetical protein